MSKEYCMASDNDRPIKIYSISMCRNEADILPYFLAQAEELFDKVFVIDAQSTDGTREYLEMTAAKSDKIQLFSIQREEKYSGAIFNAFARLAAARGADWVFFIDVDEFIQTEGRQKLETSLKDFSGSVMRMPVINLIPTQYGTFQSFEADQHFYWIGHASNYFKMALSATFMASNPRFYIREEGYEVLCDFVSGISEAAQEGLTLLHVPIRSADRFKYETMSAQNSLRAKRNRPQAEKLGFFDIVRETEDAQVLNDRQLGHVIAFYGDSAPSDIIGPVEGSWLKTGLNNFNFKIKGVPAVSSLGETMSRDGTLMWIKPEFLPGTLVYATIAADQVIIKPQPIRGNGELILDTFSGLSARTIDAHAPLELTHIVDMLNAAFTKIDFLSSSGWAELIPTLFAVYAVVKPRRFVDLGTGRGVSFFAACQASNFLQTNTQCVAVDRWLGDPGTIADSEEFDAFRSDLKSFYQNHYFIRSDFSQAADCFDDGAIDLLHINGSHSSASIKHCFDTWLQKMTDDGVIMLHDINVHERGFGVWQFWNDIKDLYPHFQLLHSKGLGIVCTGKNKTRLCEFFERLGGDLAYENIVALIARLVGQLSVDHKKTVLSLDEVTSTIDEFKAARDEAYAYVRQVKADTDQWRSEYRDTHDAEIQRLNAANVDLGNLSRARESEIQRLNAEYIALAELSGARNSELQRLQALFDARGEEIRRLHDECATLKAFSEARDVEIKSLGAQIASRDADINKLHQDQYALVQDLKNSTENAVRLQSRLKDYELSERDLIGKQAGLLYLLRHRRASRMLDSLLKLVRPAAKEAERAQAMAEEVNLIRSSGFFDDDFYLTKYRDVAEAGVDAVLHYVTHGAYEGRNPSRVFDTVEFLIKNPDVFEAGLTPLAYHIMRCNESENRTKR